VQLDTLATRHDRGPVFGQDVLVARGGLRHRAHRHVQALGCVALERGCHVAIRAIDLVGVGLGEHRARHGLAKFLGGLRHDTAAVQQHHTHNGRERCKKTLVHREPSIDAGEFSRPQKRRNAPRARTAGREAAKIHTDQTAVNPVRVRSRCWQWSSADAAAACRAC
jgi:hypothetical protein